MNILQKGRNNGKMRVNNENDSNHWIKGHHLRHDTIYNG